MALIEIQTQNEMIWTLKILDKITDALFNEIVNLVESGKGKFKNVPVILEIKYRHIQANELAMLIEVITQNQMSVIGIRSRTQELIDFARLAGLAIFDKTKPSEILQLKHRLPKIVSEEVIHSEQVISKDSDLVLLSSVQADADVIAHGSVSAYRVVQGNVFAGVDGDEKATIFIHSFNAQLVSIAGVYKQFETVPEKLHSRSVVIDLQEGQLRFQII